jgi:hypothetical protein
MKPQKSLGFAMLPTSLAILRSLACVICRGSGFGLPRARTVAARPARPVIRSASQAALYSQAQETCDYYDDNHHTDDVKDIHCVYSA